MAGIKENIKKFERKFDGEESYESLQNPSETTQKSKKTNSSYEKITKNENFNGKGLRRLTLQGKEDYVDDVSDKGNKTEGHSLSHKQSSPEYENDVLTKKEIHDIVKQELQCIVEHLKTMQIQQQEQNKTEENEIQDGRNSNTLSSDATSSSRYATAHDVVSSNMEETIERLMEEISKKDGLIQQFQDLWEHADYDLIKAWEENSNLQSMIDIFETITEKLENMYISKKDKNKTLTEKWALILQKSEKMKNKKFNIREAISKVFRQPGDQEDQTKRKNSKKSKSFRRDTSPDEAVTNSDSHTFDHQNVTSPDKLEGRLGLLEYYENEGIVWQMYHVEVSNNQMFFYQFSDNYGRCPDACKTISMSDIWGVHSVQIKDLTNVGLQNFQDLPLMFRALLSEEDNQYSCQRTAAIHQSSSSLADLDTKFRKNLLFRANSIDEKKKWIQQLSQVISRMRHTESVGDVQALIKSHQSPSFHSSFHHPTTNYAEIVLPSSRNVSSSMTQTLPSSEFSYRSPIPGQSNSFHYFSPPNANLSQCSSRYPSRQNVSYQLSPTYSHGAHSFGQALYTPNNVQRPSTPSMSNNNPHLRTQTRVENGRVISFYPHY